ncbi:hypothetical protein J6590_024188 [Homalodisca vitripennis]|nr:hypothetical protein J6590_024188 [Homalodisca vitripennis]
MWETLYGMIIAFPLVCFFFVPVYYSLGITSVYQYLDMRFKSRLVRCLASGTYVFRSLLNLGVTVFTPCVALKTVIGIPYSVSIISIVTISFIFTLIGGLRTAIIADIVQLCVMIGCSFAIILQGLITAGGVTNVVTIAHDQGRLDFLNFDWDPTIRVTTTSAILGQLFMSLSIFGCQQNFVQRYCSMESQSKVTKTLLGNIPVMTILFSISWVVGMVVYANYANCDPRKLGYITDIDEILPFYVEDKFYFIPGFLGLVMASLFNGALSFMVSNLNSLSTVLWEDFASQLPMFEGLKDKKQVIVIKILGGLCGIMIMGVAFIVAHLSGVIEASMMMTSATSGPLLGVFLLALFFPASNWKGAATGMIASHIIVLWIAVKSLMLPLDIKPEVPLLPTSIDGCTNNTFSPHISPLISTMMSNNSYMVTTETFWGEDDLASNLVDPEVSPTTHDVDFLTSVYLMTYMYYSLLGTMITVLLGMVVSYVTASSDDQYDETLVHPIARKLSSLLPGEKRCFVTSAHSNSINTNVPTISEKVTEKYHSAKNGGL